VHDTGRHYTILVRVHMPSPVSSFFRFSSMNFCRHSSATAMSDRAFACIRDENNEAVAGSKHRRTLQDTATAKCYLNLRHRPEIIEILYKSLPKSVLQRFVRESSCVERKFGPGIRS